jgi:hypothetical protein
MRPWIICCVSFGFALARKAPERPSFEVASIKPKANSE